MKLKLFSKRIQLIVIGLFVVTVGLIIVLCLNTTQKRFERFMRKGDSGLSEGTYEESLEYYQKAYGLDWTSVEACLGIVYSKEAGKAEDLKDSYKSMLDSFAGFDEATKESKKASLIEYVLEENTVFADDIAERINALETGYELTNGSEDVVRILNECVTNEISENKQNGNFDEARNLVTRFSDKLDYNADAEFAKMDKEEHVFSMKKEVLNDVYKALDPIYTALSGSSDTDVFSLSFNNIMEIDGSKTAEDLVKSFFSDKYVYLPGEIPTGKAGVGVGLYTFGEKYTRSDKTLSIPYYFYIGEYAGDKREGFGISFMRVGENSYRMYAGKWVNDIPSGEGTKYTCETDESGQNMEYSAYKGNWKDNLADGPIEVVSTNDKWEGVTFKGILDMANGIGTVIPSETEDYVVQNIRGDGKLIGVLASDTEGYALMIALWQKEDSKMDAIGFDNI